jgi:hypothetical protein
MATSKKTVRKKAQRRDKAAFHKHFKIAFKKCSEAFKELTTALEQEPSPASGTDFDYYSTALSGFQQSNHSKKQGFTIDVSIAVRYKKKSAKRTISDIIRNA